MKRTLIISDIHLRWKLVDNIINKESPDEIIFLGDYFDDFGDTPIKNLVMAEWLVHSLEQPNRIHLMGNHDIMYGARDRNYRCSGYNEDKEYLINTVMTRDHWKQFKMYYWLDDILCSHAGVHVHFHKQNSVNGRDLKTWLEQESKLALHNAFERRPQIHEMFNAGYSRGGIQLYGGIVWCDFDEFKGIPGVKQIFGHTPQSIPTWKNYDEDGLTSENLCLDTHNRDYAIYSNGELEIKSSIDISRWK